MSRSTRFSAFLILILLVSAFVAVHHHHDGAADDHDCHLCLVNRHHYATIQPSVVFDGNPFFTATIYVAPVSVITENIIVSCRNNRAPPA